MGRTEVIDRLIQDFMKTTGSDQADVRGQPRRVLQGQSTDRATLSAIARQAMIERSLEADFPPAALQELAAIGGPAGATDDVRDLRDRLWASIDNDDSRDLDQPRIEEISFPPPGPPIPGTLGPHRAARVWFRRPAAQRAGCRGPRSLPRPATPG